MLLGMIEFFVFFEGTEVKDVLLMDE